MSKTWRAFLAACPADVPVTHDRGVASNLIVRDGGLPGVVVRLARGFARIAVERDGVIAGAAALDATVAEHAAAAGLAGLEFLSGIPGAIGGAVAMNAGAYGGDVAGTARLGGDRYALGRIAARAGRGARPRVPPRGAAAGRDSGARAVAML